MAGNRTDGGGVSADARDKHAVLSGGRFPVFDRKSALAALKLRGRTHDKSERRTVIRAAMRYAKAEAQAAWRRDSQEGLI